jgi:hypothetical protein
MMQMGKNTNFSQRDAQIKVIGEHTVKIKFNVTPIRYVLRAATHRELMIMCNALRDQCNFRGIQFG